MIKAPTTQTVYAGFWRRLLAFAWDYVIIAAYLVLAILIGMLISRFFPTVQQALFSNPMTSELTGFIMVTLPVSLYFALSESSPRQATPGKRRRSLVVTGPGMEKLSLGRSLARTGLKFIPWELAHFTIWQYSFLQGAASPFTDACLALVWVLVFANIVSLFLSPTRQALYDRLVNTHVILKKLE